MRSFIISILLVASGYAFAQQKCKSLKNGKFMIVDSISGNTHIERKGSKQIEFIEASKLKIELKVKWINDCTYVLTFNKFLENPTNVTLPEDMILTVEIIEPKEKSYLQKSSSNLFKDQFECEVLVIE